MVTTLIVNTAVWSSYSATTGISIAVYIPTKIPVCQSASQVHQFAHTVTSPFTITPWHESYYIPPHSSTVVDFWAKAFNHWVGKPSGTHTMHWLKDRFGKPCAHKLDTSPLRNTINTFTSLRLEVYHHWGSQKALMEKFHSQSLLGILTDDSRKNLANGKIMDLYLELISAICKEIN